MSSGHLEERLTRVFELASHWNALLLLDKVARILQGDHVPNNRPSPDFR